MLRRRVANINFKVRVKDETINSDNPYRWDVLTSFDIFEGKNITIFTSWCVYSNLFNISIT